MNSGITKKTSEFRDIFILEPSRDNGRSFEEMITNAVHKALRDRPPVPLLQKHKLYLTKKEVAEMTGMSTRQIDYKRKAGVLKYIKHGRKVLFRVKDVDAWLESGLVDRGNTL